VQTFCICAAIQTQNKTGTNECMAKWGSGESRKRLGVGGWGWAKVKVEK